MHGQCYDYGYRLAKRLLSQSVDHVCPVYIVTILFILKSTCYVDCVAQM